MIRIIALANQKGGVGKTTTAINLSAALQNAGKKVLLVDADPQGNATSGCGVDKEQLTLSLYDVLFKEQKVTAAIVTTEHGFDLLPAKIDLAGAEIELVTLFSREARLHRALQVIEKNYDYIIIDCPPSLGLLTINALTAAQSVLIPLQCEFFALEGMTQMINTIELVRSNLNEKLVLDGLLMTMYDKRTNLSQQAVEEVKKVFPDKLLSSIVPRNVKLGEAPSYGQTIDEYEPSSKGALAYKSLAQELQQKYEGSKA